VAQALAEVMAIHTHTHTHTHTHLHTHTHTHRDFDVLRTPVGQGSKVAHALAEVTITSKIPLEVCFLCVCARVRVGGFVFE